METPFPTRLQTAQLTLRPLALTDAHAFAKLCNNDAIARMTGTFCTPYMAEAAEFFILRQPSLGRRRLAQNWVLEAEGHVAGCIGLFRGDTTDDFEIGYWVGQLFWGHGYATEAVQAVIAAHAQARPDCPVEARVFADNPASLRVLEKAGFIIVAPERSHCMQRQAVVDGWLLRRPAYERTAQGGFASGEASRGRPARKASNAGFASNGTTSRAQFRIAKPA